MSQELTGIVPPIVTPFDEDGEIDEDALRREIRYHLDVGVHGISVAGSTGEGNALTLEEHSLVYDIAVEEADGSVPVVAGAIATSAQEAAAKAERARSAGADFVMATPPHYMTPTDDGLVDYFRVVGERGELPILIYDVIDHVDVTDELAARMVDAVPELYGIKQSGGDFHGLSNMLATVGDDLQILTALDDLLYPSFQIGAKGAIAGTNAIYPRLSVELWDAVQNDDTQRAEELHFATHHLARSAVWEAQVNFPGGVKAAINLLGRDAGEARTPIHLPDEDKCREISEAIEYMHDWGVYEDPDRA
ncbi:dihydrodipicolinate synthase family protein [Halorubrum sp. CBA1125]|uniref:dihydrodipicolinate synthase family protein n=1 Tax=Halorubrum sp. CBA1125 TaxID=2668072 RepID=UPI0012E8972C|nr:dihydrodipicolinate synthase family protein [Halorubrum sp. CBA1125]MUW13688.1 dihydrodipicolinate synthase family protein [Halorubrum sp. CBA1125]